MSWLADGSSMRLLAGMFICESMSIWSLSSLFDLLGALPNSSGIGSSLRILFSGMPNTFIFRYFLPLLVAKGSDSCRDWRYMLALIEKSGSFCN